MCKKLIGTPFEVGKKYIYSTTGLIVECKYAYDGEEYYAMFAKVIVEDGTNHLGKHCKFSGPSWKEYKEPRTITCWINVYENDTGVLSFGHIQSDETRAKNCFGAVATIPITYTEPH